MRLAGWNLHRQSRDLSDLADNTRAWLENPDWAATENDQRWLETAGASLLPCTDPAYPPLLRQIADPPMALFVRGDARLLDQPQLAMVGSRNPSTEGRRNAEEFAAYLSRCGLGDHERHGLGIDAASHKGALKGGGHTVAVWGTGLDKPYPPRNRELAEEIAPRGFLVTRVPARHAAATAQFPAPQSPHQRPCRRHTGGGSGAPSGSLITARLASEQGREVFAIPGSIHNPMARGCHRLIREGAKLVESAGDILEELAPAAETRARGLWQMHFHARSRLQTIRNIGCS